MRILHVLPSLDQRYGGPLRAVLDLSARSSTLDLDSEVLGFGPLAVPDNPFPRERIHDLPLGFPRSYSFSPGLESWIGRNLNRFDGVILHGMWLYPNWAFLKACRQARVPYVCFPHGMLEPWALYGQGFLKRAKKTVYWLLRERAVFKHACAVFFTTERERKLAQKTFPLPHSSFVVVPYGVGCAGVQTSQPANPELKIPANRNVALFLGRVHPKKNVAFLMEAWAKSNPDPSWLLIIAGPAEPAYQRTLDRLAETRSIAGSGALCRRRRGSGQGLSVGTGGLVPASVPAGELRDLGTRSHQRRVSGGDLRPGLPGRLLPSQVGGFAPPAGRLDRVPARTHARPEPSPDADPDGP